MNEHEQKPEAQPEKPETAAPDPQQQIESLQAEKAALADRVVRLAAEFDNRNKRERTQQADGERRQRELLLLDLLEVLDDLQRALVSLGEGADPKAVRAGVDLVLRNLRQRLERHGVRPMDPEGRRFDPRFHDAIASIRSQEAEPGTVLKEVRKGYMTGTRLLRPASVVVSEGEEPPTKH